MNAKILRAEEHARLLDQELIAWMKEPPYALTRKVSSDLKRHSIAVSILKPPPLQRWSLLLGDAIHNLRSALDHLVYAISVHELKADPPPNERRCAFPIVDAAKDFGSQRKYIRDLSLPVQAAVESVQPYNRKHALMPPLLAVLRDFDDADKHRLIKVVLQRPDEINIDVTAPGLVSDDVHIGSQHVNLVENDTEIAWITLDSPYPNLNVKCRTTLAVLVDHAPGPQDHDRRGIEALLITDLLPEVREVVGIVSSAVTP